ncbi:MAG: histone deacetylase [Nitrospirae bacterium]|nr:histone deacetylase [Nitrospirota bacterium]
MAKKTGFIYSDVYLKHEMPGGHPECSDRLLAITADLKVSKMWPQLIKIEPEEASYEDLKAVHADQYIDQARRMTRGYLDPDTYMCENTYEAALYAAGAIITAIKKCKSGEIERAFCAVRPPGHHAEQDRGMGFCIFNNVAVGARFAQKVGYKKVFIIDFDVHHGNGTQHMFYADDTVFYFSSHQYPHYPGTGGAREIGVGKGQGFTYNIPLHSGSGDSDMHDAYHVKLHEQVAKFAPDIILVSSGYDIHRLDPLAGLSVSNAGIKDIVDGILSAKRGIPVIFTLEGGYSLEAIAASVLITMEELLNFE